MLYLSKLIVKNFAIIENIDVDFSRGFNVITGETGAGKSIVINALNLALGYKADLSKIRRGAESSEIVSYFQITGNLSRKLQKILSDNNITLKDNQLVLRRKLYESGRSAAWINDYKSSITLLKTVGNTIVDMHGQHAHQQLLNQETHLSYLDNFGGYDELLKNVKEKWLQLQNTREKLRNLKDRQQLNKEKQELWQFQYDEIQKINPRPGEMEKLEADQKLLVNAEKYHELAGHLTEIIYEGENTLYNNTQAVIQQVQELNDINSIYDNYLESLEQAKYLFQELANDITDSANDVEYDPGKLEEINSRISAIDKLQKKYNPDIDKILKYKEELEEKLNQTGSLRIDINNTERELENNHEAYQTAVMKLSEVRQKTALEFSEKIEQELGKLGFKKSKFQVQLSYVKNTKGIVEIDGNNYDSDQLGMDRVEFFIRTNPGEPITPLIDTVSGGEVSRIMLAMKSIMASGDNIPVLVFDEIDTGISGHIARVVGEEMLNLSKNHQILCITHLPQIASLGNKHLSVKKRTADNRNVTYLENLDESKRIDEIAKLIAGKKITPAGLEQARELLIN